MMTSLSHLQAALLQAVSGKLHGLSADMRQLDQETAKLRKWLGERGADRPSQDAIVVALQSFYRNLELTSLRHTRLVCFGCLDAVLPSGHMLIEDGERFPVLLRCVDDYLPEPRAFRLCYRGLLYAYFGYDIEAARLAGERNWGRLRSYLRDRAASIVTDGALPDWVDSLQQNRQLLDDDPGRTYGQSLLVGDAHGFENARKSLDIREDSWLIWRLVLGQIEAAAREGDRTFQEHLPRLLELLAAHPLACNTGLKRLLERYRACAALTAHSGLRDFAVAKWGNPWLSLNSARWSLVSDGARFMVADWLKLILIQQFFSLLAADGSNDTRRLKFWERYHQSIDDMYFALGSTARRHRGRDFQDIRKKMEGRLLSLHSAGSPDNNAFIMCMGNYVVVEFGLKGNACYIFRRDALPFELGGEIAGNSTALKHQGGERLLHHDGSWEAWEQRFQTVLASRIRVRLGQHTIGHASAAGHTGGGNSSQGTPRSAAITTGPRPTADRTSKAQESDGGFGDTARSGSSLMNDLLWLCESRNLRVDDLRPRNGNLWVLADNKDGYVSGLLRHWGFFYKPGKGWWRK
jgi:hypothetical protein